LPSGPITENDRWSSALHVSCAVGVQLRSRYAFDVGVSATGTSGRATVTATPRAAMAAGAFSVMRISPVPVVPAGTAACWAALSVTVRGLVAPAPTA